MRLRVTFHASRFTHQALRFKTKTPLVQHRETSGVLFFSSPRLGKIRLLYSVDFFILRVHSKENLS